MKRAEMVEKAARALAASQYGESGWDIEAARQTWIAAATAALDSVLPQVSTVAEMEALPAGTLALDLQGGVWMRREISGSRAWHWLGHGFDCSSEAIANDSEYAPLTVVWQPS